MMRRAGVPRAAKPTNTTLAEARGRLCSKMMPHPPPVHMPDPAMITAPPLMRLMAMESAVARTRRSPGNPNRSWPPATSAAASASKHSGWARYTSVADTAIGESTNTGSCAGRAPETTAARSEYRISWVRSSAKLGITTLPPRAIVAAITPTSSPTESAVER